MEPRPACATALVAALLVIAPLASATWRAHGTYEPDTARDAADGLMFADPDVDPIGAKVYFNAFAFVGLTGASPNVGAVGNRVWPAPLQSWGAYLGAWKDCNRDGYVGAAESALHEYRSALLPSTDVCPVGSAWNDGNWTFEFRWIGPKSVAGPTPTVQNDNGAKRGIDDREAAIWGDFGLPDGAAPGRTCPVTPIPRGTFASTGALIGYVDCMHGRPVAGLVNTLDHDGELGLRFDEPYAPERSDSALDQDLPANLWGNPHSGPDDDAHDDGLLEDNGAEDPAFGVWDCDEGATPVPEPTGQLPAARDERGNVAYVPNAVAPAATNPTGSWHDGANATLDGVQNGCRGERTSLFVTENVVEGDSEASEASRGKRTTAIYFDFNANAINANPVRPFLGRDTQPALGLGPVAFAGGGMGPSWTGLPHYLTEPQLVSTDTLAPNGRIHVTFYARVGSVTTSSATLPTAATNVYGAAWCGGATTGIRNGWDCDASRWWTPPYTQEGMPRGSDGREIGQRSGATYQLRDIDCFDGTLARGVAVQASLVALATAPCDDAP